MCKDSFFGNRSASLKKLFVVYNLDSGGAERVVCMLANAWARRGDEVAIFVISAPQAPFYPLADEVTVRFADLATSSQGSLSGLWNNLKRVLAVRRAVKEIDPDVTIGIMASMNVTSILATLGLRSRVVATEHIHPPKFPLGKFWELARKVTYRWADLVTAPTQSTCDWLDENLTTKRLAAVGNPLVVPMPARKPIVDPDAHFAPGTNLVCAVGRLTSQKGFDLLIPVFAKIAAQHPQWVLAIIGDGDQREMLQNLIAQQGAEQNIKLIGSVGNISDWYQRAQVYVMSSRFEGFGNTLAEAMAHGCACLSFDCDAGPSAIIQGPTEGVLVPAENLGLLEEELTRLLTDPDHRARLQTNAELAQSRFAEETIVQRWNELLAP